jgi:hypothetical protein
MRKLLAIIMVSSFVALPIRGHAANAEVKLVVKKNTFTVDETVEDPDEVFGGSYPNPPTLVTGCGEPPGSLNSWCNIRGEPGRAG